MKNFSYFIVDIAFQIRQFFLIDKLMSFLYHRRNSFYSKWISKKNNCFKVNWTYPVNFIKGSSYFIIGEKTSFGKFAVVTAWDNQNGKIFNPSIKIGRNCNFGDYLHLTCINKIEIGDNILTGRWVTISDNGHGVTDYDSLTVPPIDRLWTSKGPIIIEDNVWIGDKATILAGVRIGKGAVIAANAVITKDVPPYSVVAGNPSHVIKENSRKKCD